MTEDAFSLAILDSVDSTNNYAMQKVQAGQAMHGDGYFAYEQTQGRGQRGKTWLAQKGSNIVLTVVLDAQQIRLSEPFHLSVAVALACYDFFSSYAGEETCIKWPNDLYWRDRKAGGILIENVLRGKTWRWSVVGIGININQTSFMPELKNPVSLRQITGQMYEITVLAAAVQKALLKRVSADQSFASLLEAYNAVLFKRNEPVLLRGNEGLRNGIVKGVAANGQLVVDTGQEERFDFGTVEWML